MDKERFDYMAAADATCSVHWRPEQVNLADFRQTLVMVVDFANTMNIFKKLLFRGRTPEDMNLPMPAHSQSMLGYIDLAEVDIVHGIVGVITEAGECAEILLAMLEGMKPDRVNAVEESGDLLWYINRILRWSKVSFDDTMRANIEKLHGRHGAAFDIFRDANRDLQRERNQIEGAVLPALDIDLQPSDRSSSLASQTLNDVNATPREKQLAGALLRLDTHTGAGNKPGSRPKGGEAVEVPAKEAADPPGFARKPIGDCEGMDC